MRRLLIRGADYAQEVLDVAQDRSCTGQAVDVAGCFVAWGLCT